MILKFNEAIAIELKDCGKCRIPPDIIAIDDNTVAVKCPCCKTYYGTHKDTIEQAVTAWNLLQETNNEKGK